MKKNYQETVKHEWYTATKTPEEAADKAKYSEDFDQLEIRHKELSAAGFISRRHFTSHFDSN